MHLLSMVQRSVVLTQENVWLQTNSRCISVPDNYLSPTSTLCRLINHCAVLQVHEEVQFQMRRINWHPSVVIWGGNNEVEPAMGSWFKEARQNPPLYTADYVELFLNTVQRAVAEVDPEFLFVDSSPSNGLLTTQPYVKRYACVLIIILVLITMITTSVC